MKFYRKPTDQQMVEHAGWIVEVEVNGEKRYTYTKANTGTAIASRPGPIPSKGSIAGDYHTHPLMPACDSEFFSEDDFTFTVLSKKPSILGTPAGQVKMIQDRGPGTLQPTTLVSVPGADEESTKRFLDALTRGKKCECPDSK